MSRSVSAVLDEAFGRLGLGRVSLRADVANERSRALARRLGFTEEGVLRQALAFPGGRRDAVVYSILASEWDHGVSPEVTGTRGRRNRPAGESIRRRAD